MAADAPKAEMSPIVTDRPDFTESVDTVPEHMVQVEGGYTFTQVNAHETSHSIGELLVRVATGSRSELRIGVNSFGIANGASGRERGLEDLDLGVKLKVRDAVGMGFRRPAVSVIALTSLPTGTGAARGTELQPTVKLCLAGSLSSRLDLNVNANYSYIADSSGHYSQLTPTASLGYSMTDRLGGFVELYSLFPLGDRVATHYADTGLSYLLNNNTQVDVRVGGGLNSAADDLFVGTGLAVRF
jgi:hypothetical protein